jgi:hypothetical protein
MIYLDLWTRRAMLTALGLCVACADKGPTDSASPAPQLTALVTHDFGTYETGPHEEKEDCASWTLHNEEAVYVNRVIFSNGGGFHHSNWFAVPDVYFDGEDGAWSCDSRGFSVMGAALVGTILFTQSTQSQLDEQVLPPGVAIKIPPHYRIVSAVHVLNLASEPLASPLRMGLEIHHPSLVDTIAHGFQLTYSDLDIPAGGQASFTGECDFDAEHQARTGTPLAMELFYVAPHYHDLGDDFQLEVFGGPDDGETLYELEGFNADANGLTLDPPKDMAGAQGFRFTCGYSNPTEQDVGWGLGGHEMCAMLGLMGGDLRYNAEVSAGSQVGEDGGTELHEGHCSVFSVPPNADQGLPTDAEREGELYIPPSDGTDLTVATTCEDSDPTAPPVGGSSLASLSSNLFTPSCAFSSCHGGSAPQAGLSLESAGLHEALLGHQVAAKTSLPLVAPGDPDGSWLYQRMARCEPTDDDGNPLPHMPLNTPTLLPDGAVARVRQWIEAGALDE